MCPQSLSGPARPDLVECYWVIPGKLLAGEYPAHVEDEDAGARLDSLLNAGIDTFIDLTELDELATYAPLLEERAARRGAQVQYERFPIVDFGLPERGRMRSILDRIDEALAADHKVYLHCWGGVGRTGMSVGCYLVRHGMTGSQAIQQIAEWWLSMPKHMWSPHSPETVEQVQFILDWHEPTDADI